MSDDLVKRLRDTPNWMREGFQDWKDNVRTYDRAPFEAADRIEELEGKLARLVRKIEGLEALRPVWAHGWTDDSVAAQTSSNALSQLWEMLGAKDQTQAVAALEELKGQE